MLPSSAQIKNNSNIAKFADTGIVKLLEDMLQMGAKRNKLVCKIAGGSQMFNFNDASDIMRIGARNVAATKETLKALNIPIILRIPEATTDVQSSYIRKQAYC